MALLEIRGVTKRFGGLIALEELDISVDTGEVRGIIGPNGAGKTTLFNTISGFYRPTEGHILYQGEKISGLAPSEIAKRGLVRTFQLTTLFDEYSVLSNIMMARHLHTKEGIIQSIFKISREINNDDHKKALEILDFMQITHLKDELVMDLPHGSQRVMGIAIALACEPKTLLLDEPLTGMTPTEKANMLDLIRKIHHQGVTILIVEHDMRSVMELCQYITVLNFGKKLAEGTPEEIQRNSDVIQAYLGGAAVA